MGYKLERTGRLLAQFAAFLGDAGVETITTEHARMWAMLPVVDSGNWWAPRLSVVCGFASYLSTIDAATEVPSADLLPERSRRSTPYLSSDADIATLLAATEVMPRALRTVTYQALLGLLLVTETPTGEAIRLIMATSNCEPGCCWGARTCEAPTLVDHLTKFHVNRDILGGVSLPVVVRLQ